MNKDIIEKHVVTKKVWSMPDGVKKGDEEFHSLITNIETATNIVRKPRSTVMELINSTYESEIEIVKTVCHNYMGEVLKEEKLQNTVILHLRNFKSNLELALKEET